MGFRITTWGFFSPNGNRCVVTYNCNSLEHFMRSVFSRNRSRSVHMLLVCLCPVIVAYVQHVFRLSYISVNLWKQVRRMEFRVAIPRLLEGSVVLSPLSLVHTYCWTAYLSISPWCHGSRQRNVDPCFRKAFEAACNGGIYSCLISVGQHWT
jgi:hypothetical protein